MKHPVTKLCISNPVVNFHSPLMSVLEGLSSLSDKKVSEWERGAQRSEADVSCEVSHKRGWISARRGCRLKHTYDGPSRLG